MNTQELIDKCRKVKGAVTVADAMDRIEAGQEVFILYCVPKNLAVVRATVLFIQHDEVEGEEDVRLTLLIGQEKQAMHVVLVGGMLNGWAPMVGDEYNGVNRLFTSSAEAVAFFYQIQYIREVAALERASSVSSLISRLLSQQNKPKPE